jgi:hypothetical protein
MGGGLQLCPLGTAATNKPIVPAPGDYDGGEIGGMMNIQKVVYFPKYVTIRNLGHFIEWHHCFSHPTISHGHHIHIVGNKTFKRNTKICFLTA